MWKSIGDMHYTAVAGPLILLVQVRKKNWQAKVEIRGSIPECTLWSESGFETALLAQVAVVTAAKGILVDTGNILDTLSPN